MRASPPSPSRTKIAGDGVPYTRFNIPSRRAGPACPAEKCVPGGGTHGSRPTGAYPPQKKTTRRPLRGAAPACQRTPAFATVSGEIFTFWIGAQNLAGNCCDFDGGICGRGTDSHTGDAGGQSRSPLRTLSLRGAKRRGNPFPFSEGRIPTPVTRSLARNDSASRCSGGQSRPPLQSRTRTMQNVTSRRRPLHEK